MHPAFTQQNIIDDYRTARSQVRRFSPDISKRRNEVLNGAKDVSMKHDQLILLAEDDEDNQSRLEFEPKPKFKSAKNSPYTNRERQ